MTQKEQTESEIKMEMEKKRYSPPTIEAIGEVRDFTKGGQGFNADNGTHRAGGPPSDPGNPNNP